MGTKSFLILIFTMIIALFSCSVFAQSDYLLGPEDILEITVWGHDDLKRTISVSMEGSLSFPILGEIKAAGKSTQTLEKELAKILGDGYIVNPQVTVTVKEYNSQKVFVMGEVNKPGSYPVTKDNHLLYILSQAGGPAKDAGEEVVIIRPKNLKKPGITLKEAELQKETILRINLKNALSGDQNHNVTVRDGDSIVVPKMPYFFVMGEVKTPGKYNLERGLTVLMGISLGGGLTNKAAPNRTRIVREVEGKKVELKVTMETPVQPGDTLIVPESYF